jgi:hypothetical protein
LNFVLSSSSVSSISSASNSLPCNQNKTVEQTASYSCSIFCRRLPALRTHKCQKTNHYICKLSDHIMSQTVYMCLWHRYSYSRYCTHVVMTKTLHTVDTAPV